MTQGTSLTVPDSGDPVQAPRDRERAISAAYLRLLGASQADAAEAAGAGERTLRQWEACSWWPEIQAEASQRWLAGATGKARTALLAALDGKDGHLALKVLERTLPELAPAKQQVHMNLETAQIPWGELSNEQLKRIATGADPGHVLAGG